MEWVKSLQVATQLVPYFAWKKRDLKLRVGQQEIVLTGDRNSGKSQNFFKWRINRISIAIHVRKMANLYLFRGHGNHGNREGGDTAGARGYLQLVVPSKKTWGDKRLVSIEFLHQTLLWKSVISWDLSELDAPVSREGPIWPLKFWIAPSAQLCFMTA